MRIYGVKRELDPTPTQADRLSRNVGATRFAQNAMLDRVKKSLESGEQLSWSSISLHTEWRNIREDVAPWYEECSKESFQDGCSRVSKALLNWNRTRKQKQKVGFPKFRKRGNRDSWTFSAGRMIATDQVHIPRVGKVNLKESFTVPDGGRILAMTVRPVAGRWFLTLKIQELEWVAPEKKSGGSTVGIDLGVGDRFAVLSDGTEIANPRFLRGDERRLRQASKAVSRKVKGSANRRKMVGRLAVVHYRIRCRREDFLHKITTDLVKTHDRIVLEDLNLAGMGNRKGYRLGKSVADVALNEFRRQVEYKSQWYGTELVIADRWFASSKLCSECGTKNAGLQLSDREWVCLECGVTHDRDLNAARNLKNLAGSSPVSACGEDVRPELVPANLGEAGRSVVTDDNRL